jgi:dTDP-4-dehydrorhamnose 3,5-epimerase
MHGSDSSVVVASELPQGVRLSALETHTDHRGQLTEIFRADWDTGIAPVQWNVTTSNPDTLRGVHVHVRHVDYLVLLSGRATFGLRDLRTGSPTAGLVSLVDVTGSELRTLTIPPGVAHGFYFHEHSLLVYSVSHYWDVDDEFACRWDDPELGIPWPTTSPLLSERDASSPPLSTMLRDIEPWQPL